MLTQGIKKFDTVDIKMNLKKEVIFLLQLHDDLRAWIEYIAKPFGRATERQKVQQCIFSSHQTSKKKCYTIEQKTKLTHMVGKQF